jgi:signal transduction histidine kinase
LVLRRIAPTATLLVSGGLVLILFAVDHAAGAVAVIAPAVALYSLALSRRRTHLVAAVVVAAAAVALADVFLAGRHPHALTLQTASHVALVAVPVLAAEALRNRRSYVRLLLERLDAAERTREVEAQRRAEQERLRIARELHDVVAHTLTTINVQAGVAAHLLDGEPERAQAALATIEGASHEALDELRVILGVLREQDGAEAPLEPAPTMESIASLIEHGRAAGGEISLKVTGEQPGWVADAVQLAAFRIVQESLTNTLRHARAAHAAVRVRYVPDRLELEVVDDGVGASSTDGGRGLVGMRERVALFGGELHAGSRPGGGFAVRVSLPVEAT